MSAEMVLVFPVLAAVLFGIIEMSLLVSSYNTLKLASSEAARICSRVNGALEDRETAAIAAATEVLLGADAKTFGGGEDPLELADEVGIDIEMNGVTCCVTIEFPMHKATPDLLGVLGFSLEGKMLQATTCMLDEI